MRCRLKIILQSAPAQPPRRSFLCVALGEHLALRGIIYFDLSYKSEWNRGKKPPRKRLVRFRDFLFLR